MTETFDERVLQRWLEITRVYLEQRGLAKNPTPKRRSSFAPNHRTLPRSRWR